MSDSIHHHELIKEKVILNLKIQILELRALRQLLVGADKVTASGTINKLERAIIDIQEMSKH